MFPFQLHHRPHRPALFHGHLLQLRREPLAKWWARNEANTDRVAAEAFKPDYDAGIAAMERLGKSANR